MADEYKTLIKDLLDSVHRRAVPELNLLYWSVLSRSETSLSLCLDLLNERHLLSTEKNKGYPNATILHLLYAHNRHEEILKAILNGKQLKKSTFLRKFEGKNAFELINFNRSTEFLAWFSDEDRSDLFFMEHVGFQRGESEKSRIEKYKKWGVNILCRTIQMDKVDAVKLALKVLKRYQYVLNYEFSLIKQKMSFPKLPPIDRGTLSYSSNNFIMIQ